MHSTAIVANGQINSKKVLRPLICSHKRVIAVDGGLHHCHAMDIRPDLIVGDFDSCPPSLLNEYQNVPKITLSPEKDETDLEIAIKEAGTKNITLFAAWGGRIDHSLTNALLLLRHPGMRLETETEIVFPIGDHVELGCFVGQTLSLIPLNGAARGINTQGLKWELRDGVLDLNFIGISNVCLKERVEISVKQGTLLCCMQKKGTG